MNGTEPHFTNPPCVLVVENIAEQESTIKQCLKSDYQIRSAKNGEGCLQEIGQDPVPDVIILDAELADMSIDKLCSHLNKDLSTCDIPIILVTSSEEDEAEGLELEVIDYLPKPFHPKILKSKVKMHVALQRQKVQLQYVALHDPLTGLFNRYQMRDILMRKFYEARRFTTDLSVLMIDIDHFKQINDNYGHSTGDKVLTQVAQCLVKNNRFSDLAFRYGGEEFLLVLDHCTVAYAEEKADAIRSAVEALNPEGINVTISVGVAGIPPDEDIDLLLKRADDALYSAKTSGRNCVIKA